MSAPDPRDAKIPDSILELVPEAIARGACVLPLREGPGSITLFCPDESWFRSKHEDRLRFVLARAIEWLPVPRSVVESAIDFYYCPTAEVLNCPPAFRYRCPLVWRELETTENLQVRFCKECSELVFRCTTAEEASRLGREGKCVAYAVESEAELLGEVDVD